MFNKIDAMNLIFVIFDTSKHPILAQNMPFSAFKFLNKSMWKFFIKSEFFLKDGFPKCEKTPNKGERSLLGVQII